MSNKGLVSRNKILVFVFLLLAIGGISWFQWRPGQAADAQLAHAWEQLQKANRYDFSTAIEQITYPAPRLSNVGRSSTRERFFLTGKVDLAAETISLSLDQQGINSPVNGGAEIRIENGVAWGRAGLEDWRRLDDFSTDLFAPGQDAASFLLAAQNIQYVETVALPPLLDDSALLQVDHYAFDLNGRKYAEILRRQMVAELQRSGKLPVGMNLGTADSLRGVTGSGEVWVSSDGLPVRMKITLLFPQQRNGERIEAHLTSDFFNIAENSGKLVA